MHGHNIPGTGTSQFHISGQVVALNKRDYWLLQGDRGSDPDPGFEIFAESDPRLEIFADPDPGLDFIRKLVIILGENSTKIELWIHIIMPFHVFFR